MRRVGLVEVVAALAGIVLYDYLFSGAAANALEAKLFKRKSCHCGGSCGTCAGEMKNVTNRAQVVDTAPLRSDFVS